MEEIHLEIKADPSGGFLARRKDGKPMTDEDCIAARILAREQGWVDFPPTKEEVDMRIWLAAKARRDQAETVNNPSSPSHRAVIEHQRDSSPPTVEYSFDVFTGRAFGD